MRKLEHFNETQDFGILKLMLPAFAVNCVKISYCCQSEL